MYPRELTLKRCWIAMISSHQCKFILKTSIIPIFSLLENDQTDEHPFWKKGQELVSTKVRCYQVAPPVVKKSS